MNATKSLIEKERYLDVSLQVLASECAKGAPYVELNGKLHKLVDGLEVLIPNGPPSLKLCRKLKLSGPVRFAPGAVLKGEVTITNSNKEIKEVGGEVTGTRSL